MNNYRRGYDSERDIVNRFRTLGFIAVRSAGSHSPVDVFVLRPSYPILIQAKNIKKYRPYKALNYHARLDKLKLSRLKTEIHEFFNNKLLKGFQREFWVKIDNLGWHVIRDCLPTSLYM